jgi:hypothetical protein
MATSQTGQCVSMIAAADLSASQYCFVIVDNTGKVALSGDGGRFIGILQDKPTAANEACNVMITGISKVKQAGSLTIGASIAPDASGLASAASAGDDGSCVLLENGGAANTYGSCVLHAGCQA